MNSVGRGFELYGVRVAVRAPEDAVVDRVLAILPPQAKERHLDASEDGFALAAGADGGWWIEHGNNRGQVIADRDLAIQILQRHLLRHVAGHAPDRLFVEAGVVVCEGRAIVLPGGPLSGKSTLVAALVDAGAGYYSDEYAVLDEHGLVHPFAIPLASSGADPKPTLERRLDPAPSADEPVPVRMIAIAPYRPQAVFAPGRQSAAQGVLSLLAHSVTARAQPDATMAAARLAAESALVLEGERGEARHAAAELLRLAEGAAG